MGRVGSYYRPLLAAVCQLTQTFGQLSGNSREFGRRFNDPFACPALSVAKLFLLNQETHQSLITSRGASFGFIDCQQFVAATGSRESICQRIAETIAPVVTAEIVGLVCRCLFEPLGQPIGDDRPIGLAPLAVE